MIQYIFSLSYHSLILIHYSFFKDLPIVSKVAHFIKLTPLNFITFYFHLFNFNLNLIIINK